MNDVENQNKDISFEEHEKKFAFLRSELEDAYHSISALTCKLARSSEELKYKDEELRSIRRFVEAGGGLLLASSSSRFEAYADKPVSEMQTNELAKVKQGLVSLH